jgi:formate/nitrite transporter FocA (FNT family)
MLIGWLNWLYPTVPWFGWAGILAAILVPVGLIMVIVGKAKLNTVNPIPEVTLQAVKESIQCISDKVKD